LGSCLTDATREGPLPACRRKFAATLAPERFASDYRGISDPVVPYKTSVSDFASQTEIGMAPRRCQGCRGSHHNVSCGYLRSCREEEGARACNRVIRDALSAGLTTRARSSDTSCSNTMVSNAWNQQSRDNVAPAADARPVWPKPLSAISPLISGPSTQRPTARSTSCSGRLIDEQTLAIALIN
jgi:hypothetical protein